MQIKICTEALYPGYKTYQKRAPELHSLQLRSHEVLWNSCFPTNIQTLPTVLEYLKNNQHQQMRVLCFYKEKSNPAIQDAHHGCIFLKDLKFHRKVKKNLARLPSLEFGKPFDTMCKICPLYEAGTLLGRTNKIQKV